MDNQLELERLATTCADLKKTVEEDIQQRKAQGKSDRWWQAMTLLLPIVVTAAVGVVLSFGQARLQENIASNEQLDTHRLAQYEDLDDRAINLEAAITALADASQSGASQSGDDLMAAITALQKFEAPLSGLYFNASQFDTPVKNVTDSASHSKYLTAGGSQDSDALVTSVQALEKVMLQELRNK
jgi:hypothetical protein